MLRVAVFDAHAGEHLRQRGAPQLLEGRPRPAEEGVHHPLVQVGPLPRPHQLRRVSFDAPLPQESVEGRRKGGLQIQQSAIQVEGDGADGGRVESGHNETPAASGGNRANGSRIKSGAGRRIGCGDAAKRQSDSHSGIYTVSPELAERLITSELLRALLSLFLSREWETRG